MYSCWLECRFCGSAFQVAPEATCCQQPRDVARCEHHAAPQCRIALVWAHLTSSQQGCASQHGSRDLGDVLLPQSYLQRGLCCSLYNEVVLTWWGQRCRRMPRLLLVRAFMLPCAGRSKLWLYWVPSQYVASIKMRLIGVHALI